MAIRPDLRWEDPDGVVHGVITETKVNKWSKREQQVYALACRRRSFTAHFPPSFEGEKPVSCMECLGHVH